MRTCAECRVRSPCPLSHCWSGRQGCLSARWSIHRTLFKGAAQRCDPFSGLMTENEGKREGVGKLWKQCFVTQEMGKSPRLQRLTVPFILQYDPSSGHQRNTLFCSFCSSSTATVSRHQTSRYIRKLGAAFLLV